MKMQRVLQTGRKHCGKRRNCSLRAISPFPHSVFSKGYLKYSISFVRQSAALCGNGLSQLTHQQAQSKFSATINKKALWRHHGKKEKMYQGYQHFLLFPQFHLTVQKQIPSFEKCFLCISFLWTESKIVLCGNVFKSTFFSQ